jgi:NarL family two-component system response regulator LiaR
MRSTDGRRHELITVVDKHELLLDSGQLQHALDCGAPRNAAQPVPKAAVGGALSNPGRRTCVRDRCDMLSRCRYLVVQVGAQMALVLRPPRSHGRRGRMSEQEPLRVLVADDDPLARRMIKAALRDAGMIVVAEARDGREAVELALYYRPDVIVMDVVMPGLDGILATRRILKEAPEQLVVILSGAGEDEFGLLALQADAAGFISKDVDVDVLPRTLTAVHAGEAGISRAMTRRVIAAFRSAARDMSGLRPIDSPLTAREWQVIDLLAPGHSTDHIADALVVSTETVRSHVKNITRKLGVHSRADAVAAAERLRIAPPGPPFMPPGAATNSIEPAPCGAASGHAQ